MQRKKNQSPLKKLVENHESQKNLFITDLPDDFGIDFESIKVPDQEDHHFFVMEMILYLDQDKLSQLKSIFTQNEGIITVHQFIYYVPKYLQELNKRYKKEDIILNLLQIFYEVDLNGDGTMQWPEFTNYLVEVGQSEKQGNLLSYKRNPFKDPHRWTHTLQNVKYTSENQGMVLWETGSNIVEMYTGNYKPLRKFGRKYETGVEVIDTMFVPSVNQYCISYSNMMLRFYEESTGTLMTTLTAKCCQHAMESFHDIDHNLLYTGGVNGILYEWKLSKDLKVENHKFSCEYGGLDSRGNIKPGSHTDMILCLKYLNETHLLASGSMDHSIHLWDVNCQKYNLSLNGHKQAVSGLDYSEDYKLLLSCGYDNEGIIWNPYVEKPIHRLSGHMHNIMGIKSIPHTPQIITGDESGMFKLWDIRTFACIQTFNVENDYITSFTTIPEYRRLVLGGTYLHYYDYECKENPKYTDDKSIVACLYNDTYQTFVTASGNNIKVWDANTGTILHSYSTHCENEILAFCLDNRDRKYITGDSKGRIKIYDMSQGTLQKEFCYDENKPCHNKEISWIDYTPKYRLVISTSFDKTIQVHDERDKERGYQIRFINEAHTDHILTGCYSSHFEVFVTGDGSGMIHLWNFEYANLLRRYVGHTTSITSLCFLEPYPLFVSVDLNNNLSIWSLNKDECLFYFHFPVSEKIIEGNEEIEIQLSTITAINKYMEWSYPCNCAFDCMGKCGRTVVSITLVCGDDNGVLLFYDLTDVINKICAVYEIHPVIEPAECHYPYRRLRVDYGDNNRNWRDSEQGEAFANKPATTVFYFPNDEVPDSVPDTLLHLKKIDTFHTEGIKRISCVLYPPTFLIGSHDRLASLYGVDGERVGVLKQGNVIGETTWNYKVDSTSLKKKSIQNIKDVLTEIREDEMNGELEFDKQSLNKTSSEIALDIDKYLTEDIAREIQNKAMIKLRS